jgi:NAD(P)-dependent dehydrogenase (short-subunit alcohol dehydrogenase family)
MILKDKVAIVTGANRGLGKAIALKFAEEGAAVVLTGRTEDSLKQAVAGLEAAGFTADSFLADVTRPEQVQAMVDYVKGKYQTIDILVNNAGMSREVKLMDISMELWDEILEVNLRSVVLMTKAVLPVMAAQKSGSIVNVASASALRGLPGSCAYSASKAAVLCLSQALGDEVRPLGIRVNAICPGPVDTELFRQSERREFILAAGGDVFEPETVANGVLFLASDLSKGMSSQALTMRGFNRW